MTAGAAEAARYHDTGAADGYFAVVFTQRQGRDRQHLHEMNALPAILGASALPPDMTVSQAEYRRPYNRKKANALRVGLNFVDCDLVNSILYRDLQPEQAAQMLLFHCEETGLPLPSMIVFSGRGIHVKWIFNAPIPAGALTRWGYVQKEFGRRLADFGADMGALDVTRCLRVCGTVNVKSGQVARVLYQHSRRYDFDTLANLLLPYTREQVAAWRQAQEEKQARRKLKEATGTVRAAFNLWTIPDLYCRRLDDIRALCALRGWHRGVPDGERGKVLYVATICYQWAHGPANLETEAQELARQLCPSLSPADARGRVCSVVKQSKTDKPFKLWTSTIIETLSITPAEQQKLKTLCSSSLRKERKQEADRLRNRKHSDRATYEQQAQARREQARTLRAQGKTYAAIGTEMGLTAKQVDNLLNR